METDMPHAVTPQDYGKMIGDKVRIVKSSRHVHEHVFLIIVDNCRNIDYNIIELSLYGVMLMDYMMAT